MKTIPTKTKRVNRYRAIDIHRTRAEAWPDRVPRLTQVEAGRAATRLVQKFLDRRQYEEKYGMTRSAYYRSRGREVPPLPKRTVKRTLGRNRNRLRGNTLLVNAGAGWKNLVHDLSHACHRRLRPADRPHSDNHRHLEGEMIAYVVGQGWLTGKLRPRTRVVEKPVFRL